jgi:hypothetical protein
MNTATVLSGSIVLPYRFPFSDRRLYAYVSLCVALAVSIPWACHTIHPGAGPTFLPLFFFVLLSGAFLGWRAGALVGLLTPLISYGLSGMPVVQLLPSIISQATVYGLAAGLFYRHVRCGLFISLVGANVAGRLAAFFLMAQIADLDYATHLAWSALQTGWPGIVLQLLLLPPIVIFLEKAYVRYHYDRTENQG